MYMAKLTPMEVIERNRKLRGEAWVKHNKKLREKSTEQKELDSILEPENRLEMLNTINNVRTKEPSIPSEGNPVGSSANNRKWQQKRKKRYNETVWKGWRESDGKSAPVVTYKVGDLKE